MNIDPIIIFMGTPDFSVPVLEGLIQNYKVKAVVTQPDKPFGRKGELRPSPVKKVALKNNILCMQPNKIKEIIADIKSINPDIIITCAYGQILPKELLDIPKLGCINVHASLLPKLRGGAPIHHAIIDGYDKTGITVMYMAEGMDDGDIISTSETKITDFDTASSLHDRLSEMGKNLLLETLPSILKGTNKRIKQNEDEVTYAYVIKREDEKIDFNKTQKAINNQIRGLNSFPGAYCLLDDQIMKVWSCRFSEKSFNQAQIGEITSLYKDGFGVKTSDGEIIFTEIQPAGKSKMPASNFINGHKDLIGKILK